MFKIHASAALADVQQLFPQALVNIILGQDIPPVGDASLVSAEKPPTAELLTQAVEESREDHRWHCSSGHSNKHVHLHLKQIHKSSAGGKYVCEFRDGMWNSF